MLYSKRIYEPQDKHKSYVEVFNVSIKIYNSSKIHAS